MMKTKMIYMILLFSSILFGDALGTSLMMFRGRMRTMR